MLQSTKKAAACLPKMHRDRYQQTGAALQDICNIISRRWPAVRLLLCPVNVQGFEAAKEIAAAIDRLDKSGEVDTIIVARGGGSREDLWVFNAEIIARAAYRCKTPPSSVPSDTRSISRFWTLLQISARLPPRQQQSWLYQTGRTGAQIIQPGTKYSEYNAKPAENML